MIPLLFCDQSFRVCGAAALYWPAQSALLVADLHLEKASFYARQGQMLPPYDSRSTLDELALLIEQCGAERIFCLGDNFHDAGGEARLDPQGTAQLKDLTRQTDWHWITGNHDPDVAGRYGGKVHSELTVARLCLRHESDPSGRLPDISGHYHPKIRVAARGSRVSRRCFVRSERHLILPAFGALTGGMSAFDPVISDAIGGGGEALVPAGAALARFALPDQRRPSAGQAMQAELPL
jgi:hypothetical protein